MSTMTRLRGAIVGIRHPHSLGYQEVLARVPGLEIVAVADLDAHVVPKRPNSESSGSVDPAAKWGTPGKVSEHFRHLSVHKSLEAMDSEEFDVAFCFLPPIFLPQVALPLIERGCHLFSDKPAARSGDDMQALVLAAERNKTLFAVGYTWRNNQAANVVRRWVADGMLGALISVEARMVTSAVRYRDPGHYLFDAHTSGGGILHWLGCHWIDLIRFVTAEEITQVASLIHTATPGIDVEDVAAVSFRLSGGGLGSLHAAYALDAGYESYIGIRGETGWSRWDPVKGTIEAKSAHPAWGEPLMRSLELPKETFPGYGIDGYRAVCAFLDAIRGNSGDPWADGRDALSTLRVVDAAYRSARTDRLAELGK